MNEPMVSIIATAIRVKYWEGMYRDVLSNNSTSVEFIFVGDVIPTHNLPKNFKYIYSKVKPAQCVEIAARHATGKYLCGTCDDMSLSPGFYDKLVDKMEKMENKRTALIPSIAIGWRVKKGAKHIVKKHMTTPLIGMMTFIERKLWYELGGIDINFISTWYDHDLKLRLIESGGVTIPAEDCIGNEDTGDSKLRYISGERDHAYLVSCWYKDGCGKNESTFSYKRLKKFEPFVDNNIIEKSQGTTGQWQ